MQKRTRILHYLKLSLMGLGIMVLILLTSCASVTPADKRIWAGSSFDSAIVRKQAGEKIECSDPRFNKYVCIQLDEYRAMRLECKP